MDSITINLIICSLLLGVLNIMLLIQLYRSDVKFNKFKKSIKSNRLFKHDLINMIFPITDICLIIFKDNNILTEKSDKLLKGLIENNKEIKEYINNIKET